MDKISTKINLYFSFLLPFGIAAIAWASYGFPLEKVDAGLIVISIITIFFSSYLRLQLPRTDIHLTISDALITLSLLIYGGEIAVLLAALETLFTSMNLRRQGVSIKTQTIFLNICISVISVASAAFLGRWFFGAPEYVVQNGNNTSFTGLVLTIIAAQFIVNSIGVAIFISIKSEKSLWKVWNEYCFGSLVMFMSGAFVAGFIARAAQQVNVFPVAVFIGFFALVYMTYRRYVKEVRETSEKAEQAERARAEQAEHHIAELQHHIAEQDRISLALRESKERFRHAAFHDSLTDLPNRNLFVETLRFHLNRLKSTADGNFAVLFLDLNRFKTINDSLGHLIGDHLILHVGRRLKNLMSDGDLVARFSGDEFAIILSNVSETEDAISFAQLIKHKLAVPFNLSGRQVFTSVSIGIAMSNDRYKEAEDILRDADIAMYYAKERGKHYDIFDQTMHTRAVNLLQIETDLRQALERNEFAAFYQPIIALDTMKLSGFEVLIRWNHPQRGLVPPGEFIPISEENGIIVPITLWILREACHQIVEWHKIEPDNRFLTISVNLSGKHFANNDLVEEVRKIIVETRIQPSCLKLEITESAVMENAERTIAMLKQLKELGVQLSIDDFGTGYSSLSYLHRFPIDTLKVDRSFVGTMEEGSENGEIVRTVVALAKTLGMDVVAEGIETIHQLHQLQILGCEFGQGFLFSRPVPAAEAVMLLEDKMRWQDIIPKQNYLIPPKQNNIPQIRLAE